MAVHLLLIGCRDLGHVLELRAAAARAERGKKGGVVPLIVRVSVGLGLCVESGRVTILFVPA